MVLLLLRQLRVEVLLLFLPKNGVVPLFDVPGHASDGMTKTADSVAAATGITINPRTSLRELT